MALHLASVGPICRSINCSPDPFAAGDRPDDDLACLLRAALHEVDVAVVVCDTEGRLVFCNGAFDAFRPPPVDEAPRVEWAARLRMFEADGTTPMDPSDGPLARTRRGEVVRGYEYAVVSRRGDLRFRRANGRPVIDADGRALGAVVAFHDVTDQRLAEQSALDLAIHDQLTGLPNRSHFDDRLERAVERARRTMRQPAVLLIDIDRLEIVNDGYGHLVGDRALADFAKRLTRNVRPGDTVARLGGDEFCVLVDRIDDHETAVMLAERLCAVLAEPFVLDGTEMRLTASIGVAALEDGQDASALLRDAHTALYRAIGRGGDRVEVFSTSLRELASNRVAIERELVEALRHGRVRAVYQPIVSTATGRIEIVEALARIETADGAVLMPADFIPVAEETGLIAELDLQMLDLACAQLRCWADDLGAECPAVNVNCSPRLAARTDLVPLVMDAVARHGVAPAMVRLELTETALIGSSGPTLASLRLLREAGFFLGVDDFGTGYASLTYLRELPISFVKIDRSFVTGMVHEPSDEAIVSAVVRLGHALGLSVIAEGVEMQEQREALLLAGCELSQGFLFSRPVPSATMTMLLRESVLDGR